MEQRPRNPAELSPLDPTTEIPSGGRTPRGSVGDSSVERLTHGPMALVEGSGPCLTGETEALLRARLRAAALVLCAGFAAFLVTYAVPHKDLLPFKTGLLAFHAATTLVLGLLAVGLCRRCAISMRRLRIAEVVIFGLPAVFFIVLQRIVVEMCCEQGFFGFRSSPWLILMFTYAVFIPNTWRRAAVVMGLMAIAPMVMVIVMLATDPMLREVVDFGDFLMPPLMLAVAALASVYGVHMIGTLRRQAFEARQLGQYRLKRRLGAGGMGEVYLAEHLLLKRPCAIKLIHPGKSNDPRVLARFQREVHATAKLSHWNTIDIYDYGSTENGTFYYVMEYLPGMSLADLVERYGPMPPARSIRMLRQACAALREAHEHGLIHRDIKPGNIFSACRGGIYDVVKLLDFGLVKPVTEDEESLQLTTEGAITGSPLFMSPEQATGDTEPDARSDIYSLGAVGYYLLTGRPPFEGNKPIKVLIAHAHHKVVPPSAHTPDIPDDLEKVILCCLEKDPANRYAGIARLDEGLAQCRDADGWSPADAEQWWKQTDLEHELPVLDEPVRIG